MDKKLVLTFILAILLVLPTTANAQINVQNILNNVKILLFTIFLGIVVIMVTWAGILYLTARGDPGQIQKANHAIIWAIVGTMVGLLAWSFENLIKGILGI